MKKLLYIIPLTLTLLVSCQNEELPTDKRDIVTVSATIGDGVPLTRVNTTEPLATSWTNGDKIAINNEGNTYVTYTYNGTSWTTAPSEFLKWSTNTMPFNAYYPVNTDISLTNFTLPTNQSELAKISAADYMTVVSANKIKPSSGYNVSLNFTRNTARVIVKIAKFNNEFIGTPTISDLKIVSAHTGYETVVNGEEVAITPYFTNNNYIGLVIPAEIEKDKNFITLKVTDDNEEKELNLAKIPAMEAGKSYTYNLTVGKAKIDVNNVVVEDWGSTEKIYDSVAEDNAYADANTHTVKLFKEGTLSSELLTKAIDGGNKLIITGPMNITDQRMIKAFCKKSAQGSTGTVEEIDLSGAIFKYIVTEFLLRVDGVTSVKLPEGVESIGDAVFNGCTALKELYLPESIEKLGYNAFNECKLLENINLPNVTEIGYQAFFDCTGLKSINLPKVKKVKHKIFYRCESLTEVNLPELELIDAPTGNYMFSRCTLLKKVSMPKVTNIPQHTFAYCPALTDVYLDQAETIGSSAFWECTALENITILKAITIGESAFRGCTKLANFNFPEATTIENSAFYNCEKIERVDLPKTITIGNSAFYDCLAIKSINLPSATTFGESAFRAFNLFSEESTLRLTTADEFVTKSFNSIVGGSLLRNLVLNSNKQAEVSGNVWSELTWKSISFESPTE